jgi:hypothetical protein
MPATQRAVIASRGELAPEGRAIGVLVNKRTRQAVPAYSYNPRCDARSRRRWARLAREQVDCAALSASSLLTLTHDSGSHQTPIDHELLAHDAASARRLLQRLNRFVPYIVAADVCWFCLRAWDERLALNPRSPFRPCQPQHRERPWHGAQGRCARCTKWGRIEFFDVGAVAKANDLRANRERRSPRKSFWLCAQCAREMKAVPAGARVRLAAWVREPGESLRHLHRHALFDGPFVPQWLLSHLAEASGFGRVLDIRKCRGRDFDSAPLGRYLAKSAGTRALNPMSHYFAKVAAEPDAFNAIPPRLPRKRAPALLRAPSEWYWAHSAPADLPLPEPEVTIALDAGTAPPYVRAAACVCRSTFCRCGAAADERAGVNCFAHAPPSAALAEGQPRGRERG